MKKSMKKNCVLAAFAVLLLASCATDLRTPDAIFASEAGVKVNFSAVINGEGGSSLSSRASGTSWDVGDLVGISCGENQRNFEYQYNSDGSFTAPGGVAEEIWVLGSQVYPVTAYYPFYGDSGSQPDPIEIDAGSAAQQTAQDRAKIDYLFAETEVEASNPNVTLAFNHRMSRIKLQFEAAGDFQLSDIKLYLVGLKTQGTFDTETGEVEASEGSENDIYWGSITSANGFLVEAIVLPQTIDDKFYFQAGMAGSYYEETFDLTKLEPGVSYNYTILASQGKDNTYIMAITDESQIRDWLDEDGEDVESGANTPTTEANATTTDWEVDTQTIAPTQQ